MKCLECAINPLLHSFSKSVSFQGFFLWFVSNGVFFLKQQLILPKFNRPCNFEGVAGFRNKQNYTDTNVGANVQPHHRSFGFNRLSNSNVMIPLGF